jgi:hypothetical protein
VRQDALRERSEPAHRRRRFLRATRESDADHPDDQERAPRTRSGEWHVLASASIGASRGNPRGEPRAKQHKRDSTQAGSPRARGGNPFCKVGADKRILPVPPGTYLLPPHAAVHQVRRDNGKYLGVFKEIALEASGLPDSMDWLRRHVSLAMSAARLDELHPLQSRFAGARLARSIEGDGQIVPSIAVRPPESSDARDGDRSLPIAGCRCFAGWEDPSFIERWPRDLVQAVLGAPARTHRRLREDSGSAAWPRVSQRSQFRSAGGGLATLDRRGGVRRARRHFEHQLPRTFSEQMLHARRSDLGSWS